MLIGYIILCYFYILNIYQIYLLIKPKPNLMIRTHLPFLLTLLIICFLLQQSNSAAPIPKCQPAPFYKILPLTPSQTAILNLDTLFNGYNLSFALEGEQQWKKYITLNEKLRLQKKQIPDTPLYGLKSYHLEKIGNSWGSSFVALSERNERFYLSYGFLGMNTSAPVINNDKKIEGTSNLRCFDAVIFPKQDTIIVDCAIQLDKPNQQGFLYENQFIYFKISDGSQKKSVPNPMLLPFSSLTRRKLQLYTQPISGNTYLLRSYLYNGVDANHNNNTYIDIFMMTNPSDPWIVSVIDRSWVKANTMRIMDVRVYLGEIYILDYGRGVYRVRINTEEDVVYRGFYQAKGFAKFNVYSNDLDQRFQLGLANDHQVLEIDWSNVDQPILITKYSLMPNSIVSQLFLNQRFLVLTSLSTYTPPNSSTPIQYPYIWIFSRSDRTYTKVFLSLKIPTPQSPSPSGALSTFIDLNLDQSYLMVIDSEKIVNYAIDQAIMTMTLKKDEDFMDRIMKFRIIGISYDVMAGQGAKQTNCSFLFNFTLVEENNRTMWEVGVKPPDYYNANYPGKVVIPLYQYALGPNITYRINEVTKNTLKKYKIYQQDQLKILWQTPLPLQNLTFLRTETISHSQTDFLYLYTQNADNLTSISICQPNHHSMEVRCSLNRSMDMEGQINFWSTTRFQAEDRAIKHLVAYTSKKHFNWVVIEDLNGKDAKIQIDQGKGFEGNVTNVQIYGKYLYVTKRYVKTIQVYDLQLVLQGIDVPICSITHTMLYNLGIKYFSPQSIQTSQFHPNIIFIKTSDSIIILDLSHQCIPKLLTTVHPVQNPLIAWTFQLSLTHLIVIIPPSTILQYSLARVLVKDVRLTKKYPIYGHTLPKSYNADVSQYGHCLYLTVENSAGDYQIFIYRAGFPAVGSLYDVIDLYVYQPILVDTSGVFVDYVTVYSGSQLRIFREYERPIVEVEAIQKDFQFYIQYYNVVTSATLQKITVSVINLPTNITLNPKLSDIMNTKDLLYSGTDRISEINDTDWYDGNVLTIKAQCHDCEDRVIVKDHIYFQAKREIVPGLVDYDWGIDGGVFQGYEFLVQMANGGDIGGFVHLPQGDKSICTSLTAPMHNWFYISACLQSQTVNLYLTTKSSSSPFPFAPYPSKALNLVQIQSANELLILVDSQSSPFLKTRPGGVFIYALNFDYDLQESFEEIEYIDYTDLASDDKELYVVNAELKYDGNMGVYALYITEMKNGVYQVLFRYDGVMRGITILEVNYINLPSMLAKMNMTGPYDATYQAVKAVQSKYNPTLLQTQDTIIITMGVYHTLMLQLVYDSKHLIVSQSIKKVFLRYAYYIVANEIRYANGLIVLRQTLPQQYESSPSASKSKQLLTVYDLKAVPIQSPRPPQPPQLGLIGAYPIYDRNRRQFDFNLTYNSSDPQSQPRVNMAVVHEFSNQIDQLSLHRNLTIYTREMVDTQIIYLELRNDFDVKRIRILLNGWAPYPEWKLITIILFSIVGGILVIGAGYVGVKKVKAYRAQYRPQEEQRESLMTEEKTTEKDRYSTDKDRYSSSYYS